MYILYMAATIRTNLVTPNLYFRMQSETLSHLEVDVSETLGSHESFNISILHVLHGKIQLYAQVRSGKNHKILWQKRNSTCIGHYFAER